MFLSIQSNHSQFDIELFQNFLKNIVDAHSQFTYAAFLLQSPWSFHPLSDYQIIRSKLEHFSDLRIT